MLFIYNYIIILLCLDVLVKVVLKKAKAWIHSDINFLNNQVLKLSFRKSFQNLLRNGLQPAFQ
jgi:hypothetical protein